MCQSDIRLEEPPVSVKKPKDLLFECLDGRVTLPAIQALKSVGLSRESMSVTPESGVVCMTPFAGGLLAGIAIRRGDRAVLSLMADATLVIWWSDVDGGKHRWVLRQQLRPGATDASGPYHELALPVKGHGVIAAPFGGQTRVRQHYTHFVEVQGAGSEAPTAFSQRVTSVDQINLFPPGTAIEVYEQARTMSSHSAMKKHLELADGDLRVIRFEFSLSVLRALFRK